MCAVNTHTHAYRVASVKEMGKITTEKKNSIFNHHVEQQNVHGISHNCFA